MGAAGLTNEAGFLNPGFLNPGVLNPEVLNPGVLEAGVPDEERLRAGLRHEFHELCQPLAALQCRLELGKMLDDEGSLREAVLGGLEEMERLMDCIAKLRALLSGWGKGETA